MIYTQKSFQELRKKLNDDFSEYSLSNADFQGVSFDGLDLHEKSFKGSKFSNCTFKNTNLYSSNFDNAKFKATTIEDSDLSDSVLSSMDFYEGGIYRSKLAGSDISATTFSDTYLTSNDFESIKLKYGYMATMSRCTINNCKFDNITMSRKQGTVVEFDDCKLSKNSFNGTALAGNFNHCEMPETDFGTSTLDRCEFINSTFVKSDFSKCKSITKLNINEGDFSESSFEGRTIEGLTIGDAKGIKSNFKGATISDMIVEGTSMSSSSFENAKLTNAKFENRSRIRGCNFVNSTTSLLFLNDVIANKLDMRNSKHTSPRILDTVLRNSNISNSTFTRLVVNQSSFSNVNATGCTFRPNQQGSDKGSITFMNISDPDDLDGFDISDSTIEKGFRFINCDLSKIRFKNTNLEVAEFGPENLKPADPLQIKFPTTIGDYTPEFLTKAITLSCRG